MMGAFLIEWVPYIQCTELNGPEVPDPRKCWSTSSKVRYSRGKQVLPC
jgi:hypothetical protein